MPILKQLIRHGREEIYMVLLKKIYLLLSLNLFYYSDSTI